MIGPDVGASVRARLLNKARADGQDFNLVLTRYALERLLYRLGQSEYAERFLLKGALLFDLWFDIPHRPTRDIDLLGFGRAEPVVAESLFRELCQATVVPEDGMHFQLETVRVRAIRKEANYGGLRVTLTGHLASARCPVQVDLGFGDAVTPGPERVAYPSLLHDLPGPRLNAYPRETVVAEKLQALVVLGIANSRMKDYFDLWVLSSYSAFEGATLARAIYATFERRATPIPADRPFGLSNAFASDSQKQTQWRAFLAKNALEPLALDAVLSQLWRFLEWPLKVAGLDQPGTARWHPESGWR